MAHNEYGPICIEGLRYTFNPYNKFEKICVDDPKKYCHMLFLCCPRKMSIIIYKQLISHSLKINPCSYYTAYFVFNTVFFTVTSQ